MAHKYRNAENAEESSTKSSVKESDIDLKAKTSKRVDPLNLLELAILVLVTVALSFAFPEIKGIILFLPVAYLLIDKIVRKKSLTDIGLTRENYASGIRENWHLIILVVFVIQFTMIIGTSILLPTYLEHIFSRILWSPDAEIAILIGLLMNILLITFIEELVHRGLIQHRFSQSFGPLIGIFMGSLVMTLMHWAPGEPFIVILDLVTIFIDSSIYGIIYWRSRNLLVAWTAHLGVDIFGIALILLVA